MNLKVGDLAPRFQQEDQNGQLVSLDQLKGQKVVLFFYPKDNTPGCTKEAIAFSSLLTDFKNLNTVIFGISKDSIRSHCNFIEKHQLQCSLLSDPDGKMIEDYGVWREKFSFGRTALGIVRSTFLIDENGVLLSIWSPVSVKGHVEAVLDFLKNLTSSV